MKNKYFIIILLLGYVATFLRFYINNIILISIIGSFIHGFVFARTIDNSRKEIILTGFCSCFTSYTGFMNFLYQLIIKGSYLKLFFYLNFIIIFNVLIMYFAFLISRKIT